MIKTNYIKCVDGSNKEKLNNDSAKYFLVDGKYIYFSNWSNKGNLYGMDINGEDENKISLMNFH